MPSGRSVNEWNTKAPGLNILGKNINTANKNTEKICIWLSHHQYVGENHNVMIATKSFENVIKFKHLGTTVTN
jgi:hypothetical protein